MSSLDDYRAQYPAYAHVPDPALATGIYNKYYKDKMPREDFDKRLQPNPNQGNTPMQLDVGFDTITKIESNNNSKAVGPMTKYGTAKGDMQVLDKTASDPGFGVKPAKDDSPEEKHRVGVDYWNAMKKEFKGDSRLAGMAYNWGIGNVKGWLAKGADWKQVPKETQDYLKKMIKTHQEASSAQ